MFTLRMTTLIKHTHVISFYPQDTALNNEAEAGGVKLVKEEHRLNRRQRKTLNTVLPTTLFNLQSSSVPPHAQ